MGDFTEYIQHRWKSKVASKAIKYAMYASTAVIVEKSRLTNKALLLGYNLKDLVGIEPQDGLFRGHWILATKSGKHLGEIMVSESSDAYKYDITVNDMMGYDNDQSK